jgi:hypothetical protein
MTVTTDLSDWAGAFCGVSRMQRVSVRLDYLLAARVGVISPSFAPSSRPSKIAPRPLPGVLAGTVPLVGVADLSVGAWPLPSSRDVLCSFEGIFSAWLLLDAELLSPMLDSSMLMVGVGFGSTWGSTRVVTVIGFAEFATPARVFDIWPMDTAESISLYRDREVSRSLEVLDSKCDDLERL